MEGNEIGHSPAPTYNFNIFTKGTITLEQKSLFSDCWVVIINPYYHITFFACIEVYVYSIFTMAVCMSLCQHDWSEIFVYIAHKSVLKREEWTLGRKLSSINYNQWYQILWRVLYRSTFRTIAVAIEKMVQLHSLPMFLGGHFFLPGRFHLLRAIIQRKIG